MSLKALSGSFCLIQELAWLSEDDMRGKIGEARACGIELLVPMLAAEHGQSLAPSRVLPMARESRFNYRYQRTGRAVSIHPNKDVFAILFDECQRLGMNVFMPTGTLSPVKPGSELMWPYPATEWFTPQVQTLNARFIQEMAGRYGHYGSFAGWYLSDVMKWSIEDHAFLVEAVAKACRKVTPGLPVLMSALPAHEGQRNEGLTDSSQVARLAAEVVCPMDSGHFCHMSDPWNEDVFAKIQSTHKRTSEAVVASGKRYWANAELFVYDHLTQPPALTAAPASRALRQIEAASPYAERILSCQYFGLMEPAGSKVATGATGAAELYAAVAAHNASVGAKSGSAGPSAGAGASASSISNGSSS